MSVNLVEVGHKITQISMKTCSEMFIPLLILFEEIKLKFRRKNRPAAHIFNLLFLSYAAELSAGWQRCRLEGNFESPCQGCRINAFQVWGY